jgi:succinyl-diaminopimelate desuccinylase
VISSADLVAYVLRSAQAERAALVELCAALVAAPSVNPPGDTRQVADVVSRALAARGLTPHLVGLDPAMPSVLAEIDAGHPGRHLILNVHLDTMPVGDETAWAFPPWKLTRTGGRLYGLGMGNMKGAVAAMISAAAMLNSLRQQWAGKITFCAVSDEVAFGEHGAAYLLRTHPDSYGDALICGEGPGYQRLAIGEKGVLWLEIQARGGAGHSTAVSRGGSAAARMARAVTRIDELNGLPVTPPPELSAAIGDPAHPGFLLTANIGTIAAGTFISQIAASATAEVDLRIPPGLSADEAERLVTHAIRGEHELRIRRIKGWDANWTSPHSFLARSWQRAARHVTGAPSRYVIRLPASDASRWRRAGIPSLCYGPQPTWSAGVDDYAVEDEVVSCAALYTLTALRYLTAGTGRGR